MVRGAGSGWRWHPITLQLVFLQMVSVFARLQQKVVKKFTAIALLIVVNLIKIDAICEFVRLADGYDWDVVFVGKAADHAGAHWGYEGAVAEDVGGGQEDFGDGADHKIYHLN